MNFRNVYDHARKLLEDRGFVQFHNVGDDTRLMLQALQEMAKLEEAPRSAGTSAKVEGTGKDFEIILGGK